MTNQKKGNFNKDLKNYAQVNERILVFHHEYKDGRIVTELVSWDNGKIVMRAYCYRNREEQRKGIPLGKGHAYEIQGSTPINKTSALENCETSAVGRALTNAGYDTRKSVLKAENIESLHQLTGHERNLPGKMSDYAEVQDRRISFFDKYEDGRFAPDLLSWDEESGVILFQTRIYRTPEDQEEDLPYSVGHAFEIEGSGQVNDKNALENAETSSIGRALALAGFDIRRSLASKEEIENAEFQRKQMQESKQEPPKATVKKTLAQEINEIAQKLAQTGEQKAQLKKEMQQVAGTQFQQVAHLPDDKKKTVLDHLKQKQLQTK